MAETICLKIILVLYLILGLLIVAGHAEDVKQLENNLDDAGYEDIVIDSDSDFVEIGDAIHIIGKIDKKLIHGSLSDTVILITAPEGSLTDTFVLSSPDKNGIFDYSVPADALGLWGFEALYRGINSPKVEVKAVPSNESGKTALTISSHPVFFYTGENISFSGRLTDFFGKGISDRNVTLEYALLPQGCDEPCLPKESLEWMYSDSIITNKAGEYFFSLIMNEEGKKFIRVIFQGDGQYSQSVSWAIKVNTIDS
jgi:hypothetical protein